MQAKVSWCFLKSPANKHEIILSHYISFLYQWDSSKWAGGYYNHQHYKQYVHETAAIVTQLKPIYKHKKVQDVFIF